MCHWQETDLDEPSDGEVPKPPYAKIQLAAAKRAEAASKSKKETKKETQNRLESVLFFCLSYWKV